LTDGSGSIIEPYDYAAFGDLLQDIPDPLSSYLYTGQRYDATTEQYYLRAREYDPVVGRFLSRDTWAVDTWNPVELNRYLYGANSPINFIDPTGHTAFYEDVWNRSQSTVTGSVGLQPVRVVVGRVLGRVTVFVLRALMTEAERLLFDKLVEAAQEAVIEAAEDKTEEELYRWGSCTALNLTPRLGDVTSGLSTNTNPQQGKNCKLLGGKAALVSLGFVWVDTGGGHHLVRPGPALEAVGWTLEDWAAQREKTDNNNPLTWHPLTKLLFSIGVLYVKK
jgi:RHS repeat-associated protein